MGLPMHRPRKRLRNTAPHPQGRKRACRCSSSKGTLTEDLAGLVTGAVPRDFPGATPAIEAD
jgi:hypothetical protein